MELLIEQLTAFGLTRQEAAIYLTLRTDGELTGYEVAKLTGISRSNTYTALAGLVEKGAAYLLEGSVTKYTPVPFEEFSNNVIRKLTVTKAEIKKKLPVRKKESQGYITIRGEKHIINKLISMLTEAEHRVYISVPESILLFVEEYLKHLIEEGKKVVILSTFPYELENAVIYRTTEGENQIRLIIDSEKVLTGQIDQTETSTCLYSKNENLISIFKAMLQNEITLIKLDQPH